LTNSQIFKMIKMFTGSKTLNRGNRIRIGSILWSCDHWTLRISSWGRVRLEVAHSNLTVS
jgi:hypothetical protein